MSSSLASVPDLFDLRSLALIALDRTRLGSIDPCTRSEADLASSGGMRPPPLIDDKGRIKWEERTLDVDDDKCFSIAKGNKTNKEGISVSVR